MSGSPQYFVDLIGFGDEVDIMPLVRDAIDACPYVHNISAPELADLVKQHASGKYIPVSVQDRVEGRKIGALIGFVLSRVHTMYRIAQIKEPAPLKSWEKFVEIDPGLDVCPAASAMTGRFLRNEELNPLPLDGCWGYNCQCGYSARRLRDLARVGRVNDVGEPVPMPKKPVSCYEEDHPDEFSKVSPLYRARTPRKLGTR